MPEIIDSKARIAKLRALGLADKFPDLVALADAEHAADLEIASIEAARAAEREAKRRANTPLAFTLPTVPEASTDTAIIRVYGPPILRDVTIDGQVYAPQLARGPICFVPARFEPALVKTNELGWTWCSVAQVSALNELFGAQDFRAVIANATSEQTAVLIANYRRLATRSGALAKSQASLINNKLSTLSHHTSGIVQGTARAVHDSAELAADRILALAGPLAVSTEAEDPIDRQLRAANEQEGRRLDTMSARADRDATRSLFNEAAENAKFLAAVAAESAPR